MTTTLLYSGELVVVRCWCSMAVAVPHELRAYQLRQHDDGTEFNLYCPLGHTFVPSGRSKLDIEKDRRGRLEAQLRAERDQHEAERKAHSATKGQLTKARKRADNGVCQHCHRSFADLARHVRTKHPGAIS